MPSTTEQVTRHIEGDFVIRDALSREVLNLRRASRWIIEHNDWEATEEAVVSALRRYTPPRTFATIEDGYRVLRDANVGLETGLALVETPARGVADERVEKVYREMCAIPVRGKFPGKKVVTYLVEETAVSALRARCRKDDLIEVNRPISRVHISLPMEEPATSMALTIILQSFGHRGIPFLQFYNSAEEYSFLIRGDDALKAYDGLLYLRSSPAVLG